VTISEFSLHHFMAVRLTSKRLGRSCQERMLTKVGKMQTKRRAYHTLMLDVAIGTYSKL
jgi:hypothetical protein